MKHYTTELENNMRSSVNFRAIYETLWLPRPYPISHCSATICSKESPPCNYNHEALPSRPYPLPLVDNATTQLAIILLPSVARSHPPPCNYNHEALPSRPYPLPLVDNATTQLAIILLPSVARSHHPATITMKHYLADPTHFLWWTMQLPN